MQQALYAPGLGYYAAGAAKFGAAGDFVTAPEVSPLVRSGHRAQCAQAFDSLAAPYMLELGAGSGTLAVTLLKRLAELDALPERYQILEVSADLIERQRHTFLPSLVTLPNASCGSIELPPAFDGVVIANEVLDALPVERFERRDGRLLQQHVATGDVGFVSVWRDATRELANQVHDIETDLGRPFPDGYRSEVSLGLSAWVTDILDCLRERRLPAVRLRRAASGILRRRSGQGWLRCHFRHHAHSEPLIYAGIQDITSWVDFSAVAAASSCRARACRICDSGYVPAQRRSGQ